MRRRVSSPTTGRRRRADGPPPRRPRRRTVLSGILIGIVAGYFGALALDGDVALGIGRGTATGWVNTDVVPYFTTRGLLRTIRQVARVDHPSEMQESRGFYQLFSPGVFERLDTACRDRGVERDRPNVPLDAHGPAWEPAPGPPGRWLHARLYFAGLGRHVVYDFREMPAPTSP